MEYKSERVRMGGGDSLCAEFPPRWQEFIDYYSYNIQLFKDDNKAESVSKKVIDAYRVMQMMCYYVNNNYLKIGEKYPIDNYEINIVENLTQQGGAPFFKIDRRMNNGI